MIFSEVSVVNRIIWVNWETINKMNRNLSRHILPTSATMVGVCMTVISIIKLANLGRQFSVIIDKLLAADTVLFLFSSVFSYISIRAEKGSERLEKMADVVFLVGLSFMVVSSIILAFELA